MVEYVDLHKGQWWRRDDCKPLAATGQASDSAVGPASVIWL